MYKNFVGPRIAWIAFQCFLFQLIVVLFTEKEWSDESSDAFWEMVTDQLLFAKVLMCSEHVS